MKQREPKNSSRMYPGEEDNPTILPADVFLHPTHKAAPTMRLACAQLQPDFTPSL